MLKNLTYMLKKFTLERRKSCANFTTSKYISRKNFVKRKKCIILKTQKNEKINLQRISHNLCEHIIS